ncbi:MAG: Nif11 family protein [Cyanobium sp. PLM2.Bin73]|nr:MAG: Nif11 family protein [Cyanobium sp. PLM2.Bin73]
MSPSGLRDLMKAAYDNPDLEARLKTPGADPVAIAAEAGFSITAEEFSNALEAWESWRMSSIHDDEEA